MGLKFSNPVGLAAGFDKDARHMTAMSVLGFSFIEVGTVTPVPQPGNPQPRLYRVPESKALINRMGFNNEGVDPMLERLKRLKRTNTLIGGNIGKNKLTPPADSIRDYEICFAKLYDWVDYFVVNVSSPNTPGLRDLQEKRPLLELLTKLQSINQERGNRRPILLKIAPDLTQGQLEDVIEVSKRSKITGIIACNTTVDRSTLPDKYSVEEIGSGGVSGLPLQRKSTQIIKFLRQRLGPDFIIIGVGGIDSPEAAQEKLEAGADLIQIYTGLIYEGPGLVKSILKHISRSK